jgi:hypothetical protein
MALTVFRSLCRAIDSSDGTPIAPFFDINHLLKHQALCSELVSKDFDSDVWSNCLVDLLQVPLQSTPADSFQLYNKAATAIIRQFDDLSPGLSIPCLHPISQSLRYFASHGDYTESVNQLQKLLPKAMKASRRERDGSPVFSVVNALMAVYFLRNNFKQAANLLKTVATENPPASLFPSEVATFRFNEGRTDAVRGNFRKAFESLSFAWTHCPLEEFQNRRLILVYLIPVQLCLGYLPDRQSQLLQKYQLMLYDDFANAIIEGNIAKYDQALDENQMLFMKLGLYDLMVKARRVVFFQLVRMVHKAYGETKIPLIVVHNVLNLFEEFTIEETTAVMTSLIEAKLVRAYCHMGQGLIVFKQQDAFPPFEVERF